MSEVRQVSETCHLSSDIRRPASPFHRASVVELVLAVLDDGGDGLEREIAAGVLDYVLQIEILDREMVVSVLVGTAHRRIIRLAHCIAHGILLAEIALYRHDRAVAEIGGVIG